MAAIVKKVLDGFYNNNSLNDITVELPGGGSIHFEACEVFGRNISTKTSGLDLKVYVNYRMHFVVVKKVTENGRDYVLWKASSEDFLSEDQSQKQTFQSIDVLADFLYGCAETFTVKGVNRWARISDGLKKAYLWYVDNLKKYTPKKAYVTSELQLSSALAYSAMYRKQLYNVVEEMALGVDMVQLRTLEKEEVERRTKFISQAKRLRVLLRDAVAVWGDSEMQQWGDMGNWDMDEALKAMTVNVDKFVCETGCNLGMQQTLLVAIDRLSAMIDAI